MPYPAPSSPTYISAEQQRKHPPLAPDFVVELMSESDDLREARQKMEEYIDNSTP